MTISNNIFKSFSILQQSKDVSDYFSVVIEYCSLFCHPCTNFINKRYPHNFVYFVFDWKGFKVYLFCVWLVDKSCHNLHCTHTELGHSTYDYCIYFVNFCCFFMVIFIKRVNYFVSLCLELWLVIYPTLRPPKKKEYLCSANPTYPNFSAYPKILLLFFAQALLKWDSCPVYPRYKMSSIPKV